MIADETEFPMLHLGPVLQIEFPPINIWAITNMSQRALCERTEVKRNTDEVSIFAVDS